MAEQQHICITFPFSISANSSSSSISAQTTGTQTTPDEEPKQVLKELLSKAIPPTVKYSNSMFKQLEKRLNCTITLIGPFSQVYQGKQALFKLNPLKVSLKCRRKVLLGLEESKNAFGVAVDLDLGLPQKQLFDYFSFYIIETGSNKCF